MLNRRNVIAALAAVTLGAQGLGLGIRQAAAQEMADASLRLKWLTQAQFAGFYVALEKGYYKEEGINLTINPGGPNLLTENLVATGADTFGLSGGTDSVFAARDKGMPIVCIGVSHQVTPFVFVSHKDGPVKAVADFKGKKVTTWFTGANHVLSAMLSKAGITPSDVDIQPQQVSVTPFVDKQIDVVTATRYNELYVINQRVGAENLQLFVPEDSGVSFPRDTLIVSEQTALQKPELVEKFLRASVKGWKQAFADEKDAIDIIMKIAPTLDRAQQEFMLAEVKKLMVAGKGDTEGIFTIDKDAVGSANDLLAEYGVISKPVDIDAAFNPGFINKIPGAERRL
ncbi:ABC transporter substrate-binding protein [Mesorhizobium sp. YR577]|uniref:ABC transporter substrate-binding protein n=1 Tax=Mesorhizobium sp. YR577 TaxID=1884373 RepID=UPI0008DEB44E|nr:ABC transporter substrate-binding protein [Mesorhizobium sp. YR577]SFU21770.1 NitT/TauT family transport system substrate-binding protein [Mesorhizobium sp. YR577]